MAGASALTPPPCSAAWPPPSKLGRSRPQRLLDRPEAIAVIYATPEGMPRRFVWRRAVHDIARVEGPERIAPEWWRGGIDGAPARLLPGRGSAGRRFWIYREGVIGDGRGGAPGLVPSRAIRLMPEYTRFSRARSWFARRMPLEADPAGAVMSSLA